MERQAHSSKLWKVLLAFGLVGVLIPGSFALGISALSAAGMLQELPHRDLWAAVFIILSLSFLTLIAHCIDRIHAERSAVLSRNRVRSSRTAILSRRVGAPPPRIPM